MRNKYETNVKPRLQEIEAWARNGVNEKSIAKNLGVALSTFNLYKKDHSELSEMLARTRTYVDEVLVEGALLKSATGYEATETKKIYGFVEGERVLLREEVITKQIAPNPAAIAMWLGSRRREVWGKNAGEIEGGEDAAIVMIPAREILQMPEEE